MPPNHLIPVDRPQPPHRAARVLDAVAAIPRDVSLADPPQADDILPDDPEPDLSEITAGGLPASALARRRAKRDSTVPPERPTEPIMYAAADVPAMPDGDPAPDAPPPDHERALWLATSLLAGCRRMGRTEYEAMARWIASQPSPNEAAIAADERVALTTGLAAAHRRAASVTAAIDEWLVATVAVERMRARGEAISAPALVRMDDAERALAALSTLDRRFVGTLDATLEALRNRRRAREALPDVLQLDAPTPGNVTDLEILALARSCGDGTATDALARGTCILALGIGGPIPPGVILVRGQTRGEMIAQARAWCAAKIHERSEATRLGAEPVPATPDHNRSRLARENAGLSLRQAARRLGIDASALAMIEAESSLAGYLPASSAPGRRDTAKAMSELYMVSREWLTGDVPLRDYARMDAIRGSDKLTPGDRDTLAEFTASLPRNGKTATERLARIWTPGGDGSCRVCGMFESSHSTIEGTRRCPMDAIAARIFTPRDDGSCAVCGGQPHAHIERPGQLGACPAVTDVWMDLP